MHVMVIVKSTEGSEKGMDPKDPWTIEMMAAMGKFNEELQAAGILRYAEGVKQTALGKRVAFNGAERTVRDGPFGPAEEQLAGFSLWEVKDMEEAVAWVKRCPNPMFGPSEIEIRPLYEPEDFA